jgi:hypothetical protein
MKDLEECSLEGKVYEEDGRMSDCRSGRVEENLEDDVTARDRSDSCKADKESLLLSLISPTIPP